LRWHRDESQGTQGHQDNPAYFCLTDEPSLKVVDLRVVEHGPFLDKDGHKPMDD
jgi:hypothetical protein